MDYFELSLPSCHKKYKRAIRRYTPREESSEFITNIRGQMVCGDPLRLLISTRSSLLHSYTKEMESLSISLRCLVSP